MATDIVPTGRCRLAPVGARADWDQAITLNVAAVSRRQRQILDAIANHIARRGYSPTLREIGAAVGLVAPSAVDYQLHLLAGMGLVELPEAGEARAVRITWGRS